ncbi:RRM-3 domain-containing protein [Mycena venus]|uniref:RRM-3 domain-containing protein n=1 Tax=Mycena venus TaxID=2733690 RepID=A0A8H6XAT3_9AGAR|nr:RRM-3 domain-containing protein [Mycena venus]
MSAPFAFVPRKVARASKPPLNNGTATSSRTRDVVSESVVAKGKGRELPSEVPEPDTATKPQFSDEDFTILLCLSLSKYRLWSDPDLRRNIEWSSRAWSNDGYSPCPLSSTRASETAVVKALRTHAAEVVDVRMSIPSADERGRKRGNFEIRPKFWDDAVYPVSREGWDNRTVYVENVPIKYKTFPGVFKFILGLLPASNVMANHNRIQGISVPAHHSDDPGTEPKLKSFALITFANAEDAEALLTAWPWARNPARVSTDESPDASEAVKFGFRTLSKARWDELNTEYLNYRTKILADIAEAENLEAPAPSTQQEKPVLKRPAPPVEEPIPIIPVANTRYPQNCLVFVRNIHPETNKTTLRNFFAKAVDAKEAIDYVDFNKGMDSTTAAAGRGAAKAKPVVVDAELVLGKREEVYWEKVPEKVCLQAVQKALGLEDRAPAEIEAGNGEKEGRRRQRKKQKR